MSKTYYITTPIYYVNSVPHVGSSTTNLICDSLARYQKLRGREVYLLTGTDEHAKKVVNAATKAGMQPQVFVDEISQRFAQAWEFLGVDYTRFIRTSEPDHKVGVQEAFRQLYESGDIYKGTYSGWYSVSDETYYQDTEVENGVAKETGSSVERVTEENYYFKLSAYGDRLLAYINEQPDFLMPDVRRNEVIAFIGAGLRDVPVSRRNTGWGIAVPGDDTQTIYVWFDAVLNYLTATGWPNDPHWRNLWPAQIHLVGKEIYTRFHATLWPAMLMGLGLMLPDHVVGHGWWLVGGEKGSKSKGNIPTPQDAVQFIVDVSGANTEMAVSALRYYLLRDISFTGDSEFSYANLTARYNGELANDLGNLLNRALNMLMQYEDAVIPESKSREGWSDVASHAVTCKAEVEAAMDVFNPGQALEAIARFVTINNKAIDTAAPWKRAKEGDTQAVRDALYTALEASRVLSVLLEPFMPKASREIRRQLGIDPELTQSWDEALAWGGLQPGTTALQAEPIFPRIDKQKLAALLAAAAAETETKTELTQGKPAKVSTETTPATAAADSAQSDKITIQDFAKVQLRVAEIKTAERIEGATKLLRLTIDVGEESPRQLVAGIAESYAPEDLPGRKIVVVANLQPAKIRGVESNGMLLAATDPEGRAILLTPDKEIGAGAKVK